MSLKDVGWCQFVTLFRILEGWVCLGYSFEGWLLQCRCFAMKVASQRGWCCVWVFSRTRAHHSNSYLFAFTTFTALLRVFINGMLFLLVVFLCFVLSFCLFSMHFYFFSYEHRSYYPPDSLCIICLWRILWRLWMQKDKNSCYARAWV